MNVQCKLPPISFFPCCRGNGPTDAYLYALTLDDNDLAVSHHLLVRCEEPGALVIPRTAPTTIQLVDWHPNIPRTLATLQYELSPNGAVINLSREMCRYWIELRCDQC